MNVSAGFILLEERQGTNKINQFIIFLNKACVKEKKTTHEKPPGTSYIAHGEVLEFRFGDGVPGRPNSEKGIS